MNGMNYAQKPWGFELIFADQSEYSGRVLIIKQGEATPFIYHKTRNKTIFVSQGIVNLELENRTKLLNEGEQYNIPSKIIHRIIAVKGDATILEAGTKLVDDIVEVKR
jgi:quercetin dioxygenase-like cupin family protein